MIARLKFTDPDTGRELWVIEDQGKPVAWFNHYALALEYLLNPWTK